MKNKHAFFKRTDRRKFSRADRYKSNVYSKVVSKTEIFGDMLLEKIHHKKRYYRKVGGISRINMKIKIFKTGEIEHEDFCSTVFTYTHPFTIPEFLRNTDPI